MTQGAYRFKRMPENEREGVIYCFATVHFQNNGHLCQAYIGEREIEWAIKNPSKKLILLDYGHYFVVEIPDRVDLAMELMASKLGIETSRAGVAKQIYLDTIFSLEYLTVDDVWASWEKKLSDGKLYSKNLPKWSNKAVSDMYYLLRSDFGYSRKDAAESLGIELPQFDKIEIPQCNQLNITKEK